MTNANAMSNGETRRQLAFRALACARALSNAGKPNAAGLYSKAQELAEQAIETSSNHIEAQFASQLRHIVVNDRQRHVLANSTY